MEPKYTIRAEFAFCKELPRRMESTRGLLFSLLDMRVFDTSCGVDMHLDPARAKVGFIVKLFREAPRIDHQVGYVVVNYPSLALLAKGSRFFQILDNSLASDLRWLLVTWIYGCTYLGKDRIDIFQDSFPFHRRTLIILPVSMSTDEVSELQVPFEP